MRKSNKFLTGFTLIELVIVIAIIGVLSSIAVVMVSGQTKKAKDTKSVSDLKEMQKALNLYYEVNSSYPVTNGALAVKCFINSATVMTVTATNNCVAGRLTWAYLQTVLRPYMPTIPIHASGSNQYNYAGTVNDYKLKTNLLLDTGSESNDGGVSTDYFEVFSSGAQAW
ncbi:MAG: putative General secretion pathway protein GspG [Candidatus Berkelbacteria bacterium Licking1014_7]|uniref:Putative General secretion pathway protein GspG n=1 Tax=Candidatus Berkelbacteria bacterium Licking1014_7 TaxID=2017147 RepID=A0A554LKQ2_9BACT|nr:MAG: putative General secretion pathway protein GspG [Candidatus Berkelbacteria bacterium Licking1014_7]